MSPAAAAAHSEAAAAASKNCLNLPNRMVDTSRWFRGRHPERVDEALVKRFILGRHCVTFMTAPVRQAPCAESAGAGCLRAMRSMREQQLERAPVERMQTIDVRDAHALVDLVDRRIDDAEFDDLRAHRC